MQTRRHIKGNISMATVTLNLPDDKHAKLENLAKDRNVSLHELIEELSTIALADFESEKRFRNMAAGGSREKGIELLDKLDRLS